MILKVLFLEREETQQNIPQLYVHEIKNLIKKNYFI